MRFFLKSVLRVLATVGTLGALLQMGIANVSYRAQNPLVYLTNLGGMSATLSSATPSNAELQQIAQAGFKFIRTDLTWQGIEQKQGVYDFSAYDTLMAQVKSYGLRAMLILDYSNTLYSNTGAPNTAASRTGFANFAAAAVAHYKHQGVIWEIYNEPSLATFWPNPNPDDYVALVKAVVPAMRAVASDEWIVGLNTPPPGYGTTSSYIQKCLQDGLTSQVDAISIHPYYQGAAEAEVGYWTQLSQWQTQYAPSTVVPVLSTECGWSLMWSGIDTTTQAEYLVRYLMLDLVYGIGISAVFSDRDLGSDPNDYHDWFGLITSDGSQARPSYYFVQQVAASLQGYSYKMRVNLPDPNDYCLLFTSGSNVKMVAWTGDSSHTITLPSSPCTFAVQGLFTNTTVTSSGSGVSFTLTGEPCVFTAQSSNPLLLTASQWGALPAAVTFLNEADAINQIQSIVASPAWANAPSKATLMVSDVPNSAPMFVRPQFQTTLSNLSTLVPGSSGVKALFNSLPCLQEELNVPHTLTFTLQMPDGTSVSQSTQVSRKQPMCVDITTPQGGYLTVRVDNPNGLPFSGSVTAASGSKSTTKMVSFKSGQKSLMLSFTTMPISLISSAVQVSLYDSGPNPLAGTLPVVQTQSESVNAWPDFTSSGGYSISVNGSSSVSGSATLAFGTVPTSDNTCFSNSPMGVASYSFGAGWKYATINPSSTLSGTGYSHQVLGVGAWIKGDASQNYLRALFVDSSNQTFQATLGPITWTGWQWTIIPTWNWTAHWGGANDGVVHYPIRCVCPLLVDSTGASCSDVLNLYGITLITKSQ